MKQTFLFYFLLCILSGLHAQEPDEKLNNWSAAQPIEKIYLHLDRDEYIAGQTIWLKAYLSSDFLPNDKSTALFVELLNSSSSQVLRLSLPVVRAVSQGQLELPDTLTEGIYLLRAYTATMLNHDADFICKRTVSITGKDKNKKTVAPENKELKLVFFPEGGNFVAGHPNTIAFKATDANGLPLKTGGFIKNGKQEIVAAFAALHDGMGMFDLNPAAGDQYYAVLNDDPSGKKYPLPEPAAKGIVFRLLNAPKEIQFEIFQHKSDPVFQAAYMIGQMQHHTVFKQPLKQGSGSLSGTIQTGNLSSGILHITVFNKDHMPLAERLCFVNNKEYIQAAQLITDTLDFSDRGKNHFSLVFPDSVTGSFSVAISDPAYHTTATREENIYSTLLLTSDLKGYVHNPAWYFSSDSDTVRYALDLLMMTHGWRRFKWEQLLKEPLPDTKFKDPAFVTLSGRVTLEGTKKPFADKDMLMLITPADSSRAIQMIRTDGNGYYRVDSVLFFGKTSILLSDIKGKKSRFVDIKPGADSLNRPYHLPYFVENEWPEQQAKEKNESIAKKMTEEYQAHIKANGTILSEVVVRSYIKSPSELANEKYASAMFADLDGKVIDLINTTDVVVHANIFEYLQFRVPGLQVVEPDYTTGGPPSPDPRNDPSSYRIFYRQAPTISSLGAIPMTLFLNEVETPAAIIATIPADQIAMVKLFSSFVGASGSGAALAIYTKKEADYYKSIPSAGEIITYNGFSVIKEFYSPDHSTPSKSEAPDHRITLHWKPDIFVNGKNIKIPVRFYNNDRSRSFKIVAEGMTVDGKLLLIEKIIGAKAF